MKSKFNILYVSSEVFPFTPIGALGEISGALPKYLKNFGHDIRVIMPNYRAINERKYVLRDVIRLQGIKIRIGEQVYEASAKSAFIPESKVQVYFLDNKHFFDREGLYADAATGKEYEDNPERFMFFSKGCLEILKLLHWQPDIIHCNDWQTAIIPPLLKTVYREDDFFKNTKTLLSIYTLSEEGAFEASAERLGLPESAFAELGLEGNEWVNFLKMGLHFAELLNTSSPATFKKLPKQFSNSNFAELIKKRKNDIHSIENGVDEQIWNPESDGLIPANFSRRDLSGKSKNKEELLKRFGLRFNNSIPLVSMVTRHPEDEVSDLLVEMAEQVLHLDLQLLIVGAAAAKHKKRLKAIQKEYAGKIGVEPHFDAALLHLIFAGSDGCLLPSRFQSCGLSQLYGLAYGAIPIVYQGGSGAEQVQDVNAGNGAGNGFFFNELDAKELIRVFKTVLKSYEKKDFWTKIVQNAMKQDFSWDASAQKYVKLYQKLMATKASSK